jgi:hypothetical protein
METIEQLQIKWHPVYKNYGADKEGNVYKSINETVSRLNLNIQKNSYIRFNLNSKTKKVHHFVYECFSQTTPEYTVKGSGGLTINHIDGNKYNNKIDNLELISTRLNTQKYIKPTYIYVVKKTGKYRVRVFNTQTKRLVSYGSFVTKEEAETTVEELKQQGIIF